MDTITVNTFAEYTAAAMRTCTDECRNKEYMTLGLVGEAGEVANKVKKIIRDDANTLTEEKREAILGELGDVMWFVVGLINVTGGMAFVIDCNPTFDKYQARINEMYNYSGTIADVTLCLATHTGEVANDVMCGHSFAADISNAIDCVGSIGILLGYSMHEICQHNIVKLTKRYNCKTINGDGDDR